MNIYVGNLNYKIDENDLREVFEEYGTVDETKIITDRETGRSKGFGFVTMPDNKEASEAVESLNGATLENRNMVVNESKPRS
ncbi:RNA recognition motif domain-containing protein [Aureibacter tunicatorum]|uniref:RNA recognition motif-containing protein n=1 Tax=Aureibacter tunicatorum TaxID=866807 RepID=A0AAE3XME1_9BACT|nr:RNA-binding protein [Aureibacter tunicatorum]MDR6240576.1 RNA recognition motif-containing protein [Aureibacter tunicatorum]BDD06563.1 RNA-binding protein [Aureibacter tunicatorum]